MALRFTFKVTRSFGIGSRAFTHQTKSRFVIAGQKGMSPNPKLNKVSLRKHLHRLWQGAEFVLLSLLCRSRIDPRACEHILLLWYFSVTHRKRMIYSKSSSGQPKSSSSVYAPSSSVKSANNSKSSASLDWG